MEREIIRNRLLHHVHWYAAARGYTFGPGAENDISGLIDQAIQKMFGQQVPKRLTPRHEAKIQQAESALSLFVATMIAGSYQIKGYVKRHPNEIGEETFSFALNSLCPLFPIC